MITRFHGTFFRACVLLLAAFALHAQAMAATLRIHDLPGLANLHARIAIEKGICKQHNLECELVVIPSSPLGLQALVAGSVDVAMASVEPVVQFAARGADLKIIGGNISNNPLMLVLDNSIPVEGYPKMMNALKGKKIGVTARGAATEFQFTSLLAGAGLKPSDVTFVAVGGPNTAYAAMLNKQIDATMMFEPMGGFCEVLKTCRVALSLGRGDGPPELTKMNGAATLFVVTGEFSKKYPGSVAAFSSAMRDAEAFARNPANLAEVERIALKYFQLTQDKGDEIVKSAVARYLPYYRFDVDRNAADAASLYLVETKQLSQPFDIRKLFLTR